MTEEKTHMLQEACDKLDTMAGQLDTMYRGVDVVAIELQDMRNENKKLRVANARLLAALREIRNLRDPLGATIQVLRGARLILRRTYRITAGALEVAEGDRDGV